MLARNTILVGRYRIVRPLGKGGMGQVYEAIDEKFDSPVAIKETFADTPKLQTAFEREAKLLNNLKHRVLPKVTDHFVTGTGQFLVMEFIEGLNLAIAGAAQINRANGGLCEFVPRIHARGDDWKLPWDAIIRQGFEAGDSHSATRGRSSAQGIQENRQSCTDRD